MSDQPIAKPVLGIESSCDETGVAVYDLERGLLAHRLYSQIRLHAEYGGVVPELASRDHVRKLLPLLRETLDAAGLDVAGITTLELRTEFTPEVDGEHVLAISGFGGVGMPG